MDNSLKTKEKTPKAEGLTPPARGKTKTFLIGKELKTKDLLHTVAERASGSTTKTRIKTPDSLRQEASQAAGAAPTLRYGPAGDRRPVKGERSVLALTVHQGTARLFCKGS